MSAPALKAGLPERAAPFLPYGRQVIEDDDIAAVTAALQSDYLTTGPLVGKFEAALSAAVRAEHAVVCSNGTAALPVGEGGGNSPPLRGGEFSVGGAK